MKNTFFFLLLLFTFSCGSEQQEIHTDTIDNITNRNQILDDLELRTQWASFLAAQALDESLDARDEFYSILINGNQIISIEDALGENSITPDFQDKFLELLTWYEILISQSLASLTEPLPIPNPELGIVPPSFHLEAGPYLDYIIDENCLEFYFPNQLTLNEILPIASTAHPLTMDISNTGYLRYLEYIDESGSVSSVRKTGINPVYLSNNSNILVARPINQSECDYSEYGVLDFTLFLDN